MRRTVAIGLILNIRKNLKLLAFELHVPWCQSELNHCPSKFHFWMQKLLFFLLRFKDRENPNVWSFSVWTFYIVFFREEKASLHLATSNNASLTSRGRWSLDHVPSQRIIHRSIKLAFFALVPVFWHFRWIQKWLQGIQGPCGSFGN